MKHLEIDEYGNFEKIPESASFNSRFPFNIASLIENRENGTGSYLCGDLGARLFVDEG